MEERKRTTVCPWHSGLEAANEELCRRCDEFRDNEARLFGAIETAAKNCSTMRADCREELMKEINGKASTARVLTILSIIAAIGTFIIGAYLSSQSKAIDGLSAADKEVMVKVEEKAKADAEYRQYVIEKVGEIKGILQEMKREQNHNRH